jgi:hypothetical protein
MRAGAPRFPFLSLGPPGDLTGIRSLKARHAARDRAGASKRVQTPSRVALLMTVNQCGGDSLSCA